MASTVKVLDVQTNLATATNVGFAPLVRILNSGAAALVTQKNSEGDVIATFTMNANEVIYLRKDARDTLEGGAAFLVVKVAFNW